MTATPWGCFYNGEIPGGTPSGASQNLGFFVERNANQNLPSGSTTVVDTDLVIEENPIGTFDLVNNHFKVTVPGRYVMCLSVDIEFGGFGGYGVCALRVNGTTRTDEESETATGDIIRMGNSFCIQLDVDDIVDAIVFNGDIFAATLVGCQNQFSGALIATP